MRNLLIQCLTRMYESHNVVHMLEPQGLLEQQKLPQGLPEELPEGLAQMAPGPRLAGVLAGLSGRGLGDAQRHVVAAAWARQVAHEQAGLLAAMLAAAGPAGVGEGEDDPVVGGRNGEPDEFRGDQLAFELRWSRTTVYAYLDVAEELIVRLPMVYASLRAGRIDLAKARAFAEALMPLSLLKAQAVAARLLLTRSAR
jgi:hypothetical protein